MNKYLSLIKFSHTIFALPFALIGFSLASTAVENYSFSKLILVIICMVTARSAAMGFNRYIDRDIDSKNERTAIREIPSGQLKSKNVLYFVIANCLMFILCTYFINPLCFYLSPVALGVVLGYSFTKRFTFLCHLILGIGLALAPIGAYIAVTAKFDIIPIIFGISVLFWVAGFDIIYALQDEEFDRKEGLNSIPVFFGRTKAMFLSRSLHLASASFLVYGYYLTRNNHTELGYLSIIGLVFFLSLLFYQHTLVSEKDLSKVNLAFFTTNGIASVIFGTLLIADLFL